MDCVLRENQNINCVNSKSKILIQYLYNKMKNNKSKNNININQSNENIKIENSKNNIPKSKNNLSTNYIMDNKNEVNKLINKLVEELEKYNYLSE